MSATSKCVHFPSEPIGTHESLCKGRPSKQPTSILPPPSQINTNRTDLAARTSSTLILSTATPALRQSLCSHTQAEWEHIIMGRPWPMDRTGWNMLDRERPRWCPPRGRTQWLRSCPSQRNASVRNSNTISLELSAAVDPRCSPQLWDAPSGRGPPQVSARCLKGSADVGQVRSSASFSGNPSPASSYEVDI